MPKADVTIEVSFDKVSSAAKEEEEEDANKEDTAVGDDKVAEPIILTIGSKVASVFGENVVNDVAPEIVSDRTMLPIRFVVEALGGSVAWDETAKKVTITLDETVIEIFVGQPFAMVNGNPVQLDAPAYIANDRTYLPLRFVAENLGATVTWNGETREVTIVPGK